MSPPPGTGGHPSYVDLFWLPLGAGDTTGLVLRTGRLYEAWSARRQRREARPLFHSALEVAVDGALHVIEMTPEWGLPPGDRGVVAEGPVGFPVLGHSRLFRYEIHRWRDGVIPDRDEAVGGALRLASDVEHARRILGLVPAFPVRTWGRDEQATGDMWNSNSLTSWLLVRSGHSVDTLAPPDHGRAPGWSAGLVVAARQELASVGMSGSKDPRVRGQGPWPVSGGPPRLDPWK